MNIKEYKHRHGATKENLLLTANTTNAQHIVAKSDEYSWSFLMQNSCNFTKNIKGYYYESGKSYYFGLVSSDSLWDYE